MKKVIGTMRVIIFGNKITVDMRKNYISFLVIGLVLLLSGCVKDQRIDALKLVAEGGRNSESKMIITDEYSDWAAGDEVRINGTIANVELIDGAAYVSGGDFEAPFYGIYPASIYRSNNGSSYTVNVPGTYTYSATEGKQLLQSPMVGYAESGNYIFFRHLTSAVTVQITNYYGFTVIVDSVIVISNSYKLHGDITFSLGADISIPATEKVGGDTVVMLGGGLQVVSGNTVNVQVPVLPQGSGNIFTLQVKVHKYNNTDVKRRFDSTQPNSHPLARNQIGYAPMTVGFPFSVGINKKVIISQGNLQYRALPQLWQFAENQYSYIGSSGGNATEEADRSEQSAFIDLFGWGTSGWNNGNVYYQPYNAITTGAAFYYGPKNGSSYTVSLVGNYAKSDWGVHNEISNGGGVAGKWRLLTAGTGSEADTLFNKRTTITSNMPSGENSNQARYIKARVTTSNIKGLIIFPDNYKHPSGVSVSGSGRIYNSRSTNCYYEGFTVDNNSWNIMESEGAVFIPAAGYRINLNLYSIGTDAYYWYSTHNTKDDAYALKFLNNAASSLYDGTAKNYGCSVRLVQDIR